MQRRLRRLVLVTGLLTVLAAISASSAFAVFQAETLPARNIGPHSVELRGKVFLEEQQAFVGFEYGETTAYGNEYESTPLPKQSGWVYVSARIHGLKDGTTYHYRFAALSPVIDYGEDATVTTTQPIFRAEKYPAEFNGGNYINDPFLIGVESGKLDCGTGLKGEQSADSESVTLTPIFEGCSLAGLNATVSVNGCSYVIHAGEGTSGTLDIACPSGKAITVSAGNCAMSIPAQTGLSQVDAGVANAENVLEFMFDVSSLKYTKTNDGFLCPFNGTGTKEDGTYDGKAGVEGEYMDFYSNALGFVPTAVFQADQYPATLSGQQAAGDPLSLGVEAGGTLTCDSITAGGGLAAEAVTLSLSPAYSGCKIFGFYGSTVTLNGCEYAFHAGSVTADTMDIVCPAGKAIAVHAGNCDMTIPAQTGLAVEASNDTSGSPQKLQLELGATGLEYTKNKDGFLCPFNGTGTKTDGTLDGTLSVSATNAAKAAIGVGVSS